MRFSFARPEMREGPVQILFVCTGNICRSPLAEVLLRQALHDLPVVVTSAGTHALVGYAMAVQNQRIASAYGIEDVEEHHARQLTSEMIKNADLVLALGREHRREIVSMLARASRYAFTLREFGRLARACFEQGELTVGRADSPDHLRKAITSAIRLRGTLPLLEDPSDDDVVDPYGMEDSVYQASAKQLVPSISYIAHLLRSSVTEVT